MMGQSQSTIQMAPQDTISGDQVVEAKKDADKTNPTVPAKTKDDNPKKLTDDEKKEVAGKVTEANKDKFPERRKSQSPMMGQSQSTIQMAPRIRFLVTR